jgi:hypothetical protein
VIGYGRSDQRNDEGAPMFGRMKDPVNGTATLVSYVETSSGNQFDRVITAQVVVRAEGLTPTAVEWDLGVSSATLPLQPGYTWPVIVDRANPTHLKEDWRREQQAGEAARLAGRAEAERLAESLRNEPADKTAEQTGTQSGA